MKKNKITFLLTLKDRSEHTEYWIKNNFNPKYHYHIADGSINKENEEIFFKYQHKNIVYKHYGFDNSISKYLNKIRDSIKEIESEYIMLCDNDDFINSVGVEKCINALDNNSDFTCAGGAIYSVFQNPSNQNLYNLPIPFLNNSKIHNCEESFSTFVEVRREYKYLYYSVFRKADLIKIWNFIVDFNINDLFLIEMLYNDLTLFWGKYYDIGHNHYIRLMNTNKSGANSYGSYYHKRVFFDNNYREELAKLNLFYSKIYNKEVKKIEEIQTNFYLWYFNQPPRVKNIFFRKIHGMLIRFPFFKIKMCIKYLNIFFSLKNKVNV
jgi:glycosyltransferase domain-containing protein